MHKLIAIVSFALSLYGCDFGGSTSVQQRSVDGEAVLHSRVVARPGLMRFDCLRSASGRCHYTLYAPDCDSAAGTTERDACVPRPVEHFTLASGRSRQVAMLGTFRSCVSTGPTIREPECDAPDSIATR
jgi:hypothetical protein